jgi:hypothetical protein
VLGLRSLRFLSRFFSEIMNALILHCGGQLKSRQEVFAFPVPPATGQFTPLPHELLITHVEERLEIEGIGMREQRFAVTNKGQRLFGLMELELPEFQNQGYGGVLGLRNSYDRSFPAGLCIGSVVFVCDNLGFHGSHAIFHVKETETSDILAAVSEAVAKIPTLFAQQSRSFKAYHRTQLNDQLAQDLVGRFFDRGALNLVEVPRVWQEWQAPRHPEFAESPKTAWRLFNAATEILKGDLWGLPEKTFAIHQVLDQACGIAALTARVQPQTKPAALTSKPAASELIAKEQSPGPP